MLDSMTDLTVWSIAEMNVHVYLAGSAGVVVDRFYIALFSALKHSLCSHVILHE